MSIIKAVEADILHQISETLVNCVSEIKTLPGPWSYDLLKQVLQKAPAVYVSFLGGQGNPDGFDASINARFDVYAVTKHFGNQQSARHGTNRTIGAYEIIETILPRLHGHTIDDVGTLQLRNVDNLFGEAMFELGGIIYAATFSLPNMTFPLNSDLTILSPFEIYNATHQLADGLEPSAEDHVELPQE